MGSAFSLHMIEVSDIQAPSSQSAQQPTVWPGVCSQKISQHLPPLNEAVWLHLIRKHMLFSSRLKDLIISLSSHPHLSLMDICYSAQRAKACVCCHTVYLRPLTTWQEEVGLTGMFTVLLTALMRLSHLARLAPDDQKSLCHTPVNATDLTLAQLTNNFQLQFHL